MRALLASIAAAALIAAAAAPSIPSVPPCIEEDGSGQTVCYWNAAARGNHMGNSYVIEGERA